MIKFLFKLILIVVVLVLLAAGGIYYYAGTIIKTTVEKYAPQVTQTTVKLDSIDLSLLQGKISLNGLSVSNPKDYGAAKAFGLGGIYVSFDPKSLLSDKIVINQIIIDKTAVDVEATYKDGQITSNLTEIQKNVESFIAKNTSASSPKAEEQPTQPTSDAKTESAPAKQVVIRDLQINNSELTVGVLKKTLTVPLPNIHQQNIGEKGKQMSWQDSIAYVFNLISTEAVKETATAVQKVVQDAAMEAINISGATVDGVKESADGILSNVKGLFGE